MFMRSVSGFIIIFTHPAIIDRPSQKLHYPDLPLKIVRGRGQYFFDENDKKYLDTTNNVAHGESPSSYIIL